MAILELKKYGIVTSDGKLFFEIVLDSIYSLTEQEVTTYLCNIPRPNNKSDRVCTSATRGYGKLKNCIFQESGGKMEGKQLIITIITILLIIGLYYLTLLPKKKQEKEIQKMQSELKKGDKVITYTGLSGTVEEVLEDRIILKTRPDNIKLSIEKWAIAGVDDRNIDK